MRSLSDPSHPPSVLCVMCYSCIRPRGRENSWCSVMVSSIGLPPVHSRQNHLKVFHVAFLPFSSSSLSLCCRMNKTQRAEGLLALMVCTPPPFPFLFYFFFFIPPPHELFEFHGWWCCVVASSWEQGSRTFCFKHKDFLIWTDDDCRVYNQNTRQQLKSSM